MNATLPLGEPVITAPAPATSARALVLDWFDTVFWPMYPRRVAKAAARKAFVDAFKVGRKCDADADLLKSIMDGLGRSKKAAWVGVETQYIPHASTWLNGRRWEDEVPQPADTSKQPCPKCLGRGTVPAPGGAWEKCRACATKATGMRYAGQPTSLDAMRRKDAEDAEKALAELKAMTPEQQAALELRTDEPFWRLLFFAERTVELTRI